MQIFQVLESSGEMSNVNKVYQYMSDNVYCYFFAGLNAGM